MVQPYCVRDVIIYWPLMYNVMPSSELVHTDLEYFQRVCLLSPRHVFPSDIWNWGKDLNVLIKSSLVDYLYD